MNGRDEDHVFSTIVNWYPPSFPTRGPGGRPRPLMGDQHLVEVQWVLVEIHRHLVEVHQDHHAPSNPPQVHTQRGR